MVDSNQPDDKTLALLMVVAGIIKDKDHSSGVNHLTTMYERAIEEIRWRRAGAPQTLANSQDQ
jgi:folylpolyglutamate synthase/dihydropteroate synthase